jgi:hypothetical protein
LTSEVVWTRQFQLLRLRSTLVSLAASGAAELIGRRLDPARESVVLNEYHLKFLDHLIRYNVRFLVIGGQARRFQSPSHKTTDLDIWVSLAPGDRKSLEAALANWSRLHPQHTNQPLVPPLNLRPNVQIHFPETDGVFYLDRSDRMAQVDAEQGVDVLTSLGDLEFDLAMSRAEMATVEGLTVNYLGSDDLERI